MLDRRRSRVEAAELNFARFGADLLDGLSATPDPDPVLIEEVKRGCTLAMLCCLDRDQRLAFVLSEVFDLSHSEAADLCSVDAATFRQRLSRARRSLEAFTRSYCGLVNIGAPCKCDRRVRRADELGRIHRTNPRLARWPVEEVDSAVRNMESLHETAKLLRAHPLYVAPADVLARVREAIAATGLGEHTKSE
jgi:hypothetical protein